MSSGTKLVLKFFDDMVSDETWGAENDLICFDAEWRARL